MDKQISEQIDKQIQALLDKGVEPNVIQMDCETLTALYGEKPAGITNYSYKGYDIVYPLNDRQTDIKVIPKVS